MTADTKEKRWPAIIIVSGKKMGDIPAKYRWLKRPQLYVSQESTLDTAGCIRI